MTGYGKANCECNNHQYTIEIKSLNSKQSDINIRIPQFFKEKEIAIRNLLNNKLVRGKIECSIRMENESTEKGNSINKNLFKEYFRQLKTISEELGSKVDDETIFKSVVRLPDLLRTGNDELSDEEWKMLEIKMGEALAQLESFRVQEGNALSEDIIYRIDSIYSLLQKIPAFEDERMQTIKERLQKNLADSVSSENVDLNRFEQEIIYYLEKLDITEEKIRLANHLSYFKSTSEENDLSGKKLGFITQEIGREINTIGSKASHTEIQKIVVQMKDELEKIKEQLMNVL
jgi:uncharacterized protein (TIGR00255 family)